MGSELEELRGEAARLEAELEKTRELNRQAAEAGLQLLTEKEELNHRVSGLQSEIEVARSEVDVLTKKLDEFQSKHKAAAKSELENEQALLAETSEKERVYEGRIAQLEDECHKKTKELERTQTELDRLQNAYAEVGDATRILEEEGRRLKRELKEVRESEQRLNAEREDLELDNIGLQKTVANLRSAQVEFDAMKMTYQERDEEIYFLKAALDENEKLRAIAIAQMEEALQTAHQEREQRLAMKRELEASKNAEHMNNMHSLHDLMQRLTSDGDEEGSEPHPPANDLFSELQGSGDSRIQELETTRDRLEEQVAAAEKTTVDFVRALCQKMNINLNSDLDFRYARQQKDLVLERLDALMKSGSDPEAEKKAQTMKGDLRILLLLAGERNAQLAAAQDMMISLSDSLYQFYHQMAQSAGIPNDRQVVDVVKRLRTLAKENAEEQPHVSLADEGLESGTETESGGARASIPFNAARSVLPPGFIREVDGRLTGTRTAQIMQDGDLRQRVMSDERAPIVETSEAVHKLVLAVRRCAEQTMNTRVEASGQETEEVLLQNIKLRSLLSTKRDQISTLRTVLKSNKITAETALNSLRDKYESEKRLSHDLMEKQRRELKQLKEDAATFAAHRAMFTARCEELQALVDELKAENKSNEDEKRTLNQLLRMAIQQKLALTQRLEDVEVAQDRSTIGRQQRNGRQQPALRENVPRAVRYPPGGGGGPNSSRKRDHPPIN
ncbi:unnamed protein product, partial [Mesorhabditis spiculigera]